MHYPLEVSATDFSDAALVLVGHGSTLNEDSALPTWRHADELRRRGIFAQVLECFWKQEPAVCAVLRGVRVRRVFIVPLFISEGYFTEQVIPRDLGLLRAGETGFERVQELNGMLLHYCGPIGTHASMTEALLARAREIVQKHPGRNAPAGSETALFIAGHGTGNSENSRKAIERQVELIAARGEYAEVHAIFMEEEPRIQDAWSIAKAPNIVMVPFFVSDGLHSYEDIPMMLGEPEEVVRQRMRDKQPTWVNPTEREGKRAWYTSAIGGEPHIVDVVLERVREMVSGG